MMAKPQFEPMTHQRVTAMSAQGARDFFGGAWFKTVCVGQALDPRNRFGARIYLLFRTESDWNKYQADEARYAAAKAIDAGEVKP
jgi:hypothetical protein